MTQQWSLDIASKHVSNYRHAGHTRTFCHPLASCCANSLIEGTSGGWTQAIQNVAFALVLQNRTLRLNKKNVIEDTMGLLAGEAGL